MWSLVGTTLSARRSCQQRETPMETESRRVANAARQQATQLNMSTEQTGIRRSADAN